MWDKMIEIDGQSLIWIQENLRFAFLTPIMKFITHLGDAGIFWILLTLGLLIFKKTRRVGVMSAVALLGALIIDNIILKNLVGRVRPYEVVDGLQCLIGAQKDFSFPSGHTGSSFASAVVCFKELPKRYGIPLLVLAFLIAFSRLYVGVHYPTDVLAGMVIGTMLALLSCKIVNQAGKKTPA